MEQSYLTTTIPTKPGLVNPKNLTVARAVILNSRMMRRFALTAGGLRSEWARSGNGPVQSSAGMGLPIPPETDSGKHGLSDAGRSVAGLPVQPPAAEVLGASAPR